MRWRRDCVLLIDLVVWTSDICFALPCLSNYCRLHHGGRWSDNGLVFAWLQKGMSFEELKKELGEANIPMQQVQQVSFAYLIPVDTVHAVFPMGNLGRIP